MANVLPAAEEKKYELGIILHFVDQNTSVEAKYRDNFKNESVLFINVLQSSDKVIKLIKQCKNIISSSLQSYISNILLNLFSDIFRL